MTAFQARVLERSAEAVAAAERAASASDGRTAANRAYYAMFFAAWALLADTPDVGRRHRAVQAAFGEQFVRPGLIDARLHRWLLDAFELRLLADYDPMTDIEPEIIAEVVDQAGEFRRTVAEVLSEERDG